MNYLMFQNPGVADPAGFTLLGASGSRGNSNMIGMFGTGSNFAVATLLRMGVKPVIIPGNLKMEFDVKGIMACGKAMKQIVVKYSGKDINGNTNNRTDDLSVTTSMGIADWTKPSMALREFISNAIDGATASGKTYKDVVLNFADKPRAKAGHTSVFIPVNPDIIDAFTEIKESFLHFTNESLLTQTFLPKQKEGVVSSYKKGVLVNQNNSKQSLFDYNFGDSLRLDECRNADNHDIYSAATYAWLKAPADKIATLLRGCHNDIKGELLESNISSYSFYDCKENHPHFKRWKDTFISLYGEQAVVSADNTLDTFVAHKGFKAVFMPRNIYAILERCGVKTEKSVLTEMEVKGRVTSEATPAMIEAVSKVWELLGKYKMLNGRNIPQIMGFKEVMNAGSQVMGEYKDGIVYLHENLGGRDLLKVALEEVVHHVTGAGDMSRDLQDYTFNLVTLMGLTNVDA